MSLNMKAWVSQIVSVFNQNTIFIWENVAYVRTPWKSMTQQNLHQLRGNSGVAGSTLLEKGRRPEPSRNSPPPGRIAQGWGALWNGAGDCSHWGKEAFLHIRHFRNWRRLVLKSGLFFLRGLWGPQPANLSRRLHRQRDGPPRDFWEDAPAL